MAKQDPLLKSPILGETLGLFRPPQEPLPSLPKCAMIPRQKKGSGEKIQQVDYLFLQFVLGVGTLLYSHFNRHYENDYVLSDGGRHEDAFPTIFLTYNQRCDQESNANIKKRENPKLLKHLINQQIKKYWNMK